MSDAKTLEALSALFVDAGTAHHEAFAATDGEDSDWALWYANYLVDRVASILGIRRTRSELVACLLQANDEHRTRAPARPWHEYYAEHFVECYAASSTATQDSLALYHFDSCPFCVRVRHTIDELGIDVELRNIWDNPEHRRALAAARGRTTVPVLRITDPNGDERWMPESRDIIRYLKQTYA